MRESHSKRVRGDVDNAAIPETARRDSHVTLLFHPKSKTKLGLSSYQVALHRKLSRQCALQKLMLSCTPIHDRILEVNELVAPISAVNRLGVSYNAQCIDLFSTYTQARHVIDQQVPSHLYY